MKIRIALLLDSSIVPAWTWEAISQLYQKKNAEVVLAVINETPIPSGEKSPFLYRVYRYLDRKLFLTQPDAFAKKDLREIPDWIVPQLRLTPIQKKYSDYFRPEDLEKISEYQPDLIIRLGFRILRGEILSMTRFGVWSFHHGDPEYYRGGPPGFWEVMNRQPITGFVLMQLTEQLDQGKILYQSWMQTDPLSVQRNANRLFWASAYAPVRVIQEIEKIGLDNWNKNISNSRLHSKAPLWKPPGTWKTLHLWTSLVNISIKRKWEEFQSQAHWQIGKVTGSINGSSITIDPTDIQLLEHYFPDRYFLADPFTIELNGTEFLFAEEFDKKKNKGRIVWISQSEAGIQIHPVLDEAWHLSYPFLWKDKNQVFMIPESSESGKVYMYQAVDFPLKWENTGILFEHEGYDPTLVKKDGLFWLFITQKAHPACWPFDELNLYWTEDLERPKWNAHPKNPVVSDVRKARSAGKLFEKDGQWFRPAQNSGIRYGHQVRLQKVSKWSKSEYEEETVQIIQAADPALGIHTWNGNESGTWVDIYFRR